MDKKLLDKLMSRISKAQSGCWEWTWGLSNAGYGRLGYKGKNTQASRVMWIAVHGSIPNGLWVLHRCDNPKCINPDHLFLGTRKDNIDDMVRKGRGNALRGAESNKAKLTEEIVRQIRKEHHHSGIGFRPLGRKYGVSDMAIRKLISGQSWKHIT